MAYIAPIKIGASEKVTVSLASDIPENPTTWTNSYLKNWVLEYSNGQINVDSFCPYESGRQLITMAQQEFLQRLMDQGFSERSSFRMHNDLWNIVVMKRSAALQQEEEQAKIDQVAKIERWNQIRTSGPQYNEKNLNWEISFMDNNEPKGVNSGKLIRFTGKVTI